MEMLAERSARGCIDLFRHRERVGRGGEEKSLPVRKLYSYNIYIYICVYIQVKVNIYIVIICVCGCGGGLVDE